MGRDPAAYRREEECLFSGSRMNFRPYISEAQANWRLEISGT